MSQRDIFESYIFLSNKFLAQILILNMYFMILELKVSREEKIKIFCYANMRKSFNSTWFVVIFSIVNICALIKNYEYATNKEPNNFPPPKNTPEKTAENSKQIATSNTSEAKTIERYFGREDSRDFFRYKCKSKKRVGGEPRFIQAVPDALYRSFN